MQGLHLKALAGVSRLVSAVHHLQLWLGRHPILRSVDRIGLLLVQQQTSDTPVSGHDSVASRLPFGVHDFKFSKKRLLLQVHSPLEDKHALLDSLLNVELSFDRFLFLVQSLLRESRLKQLLNNGAIGHGIATASVPGQDY